MARMARIRGNSSLPREKSLVHRKIVARTAVCPTVWCLVEGGELRVERRSNRCGGDTSSALSTLNFQLSTAPHGPRAGRERGADLRGQAPSWIAVEEGTEAVENGWVARATRLCRRATGPAEWEGASCCEPAADCRRGVPPVPVGGSPTGTGWQPVLPVSLGRK